ncbi:MAG: hypothetical protein V3T72_06380 [Thermoanaerobaculia bacterium]
MNSIERRHFAVLGILDSSRAWQQSTAEALTELLRPELAEGEVMPDLELLQCLFRRALARHWRRLRAADDSCRSTAYRRRTLVARVAVARKKLHRAIAGLRARLADVFGAAAAKEHFVLRGTTAEVSEELLRQAGRVVAWLRDPSKSLPEGACRSTLEDRLRGAEPIAAGAEVLDSLLVRASLECKRAEAAKAERRRLRGPYDDLFVVVASWFEASYRAAGRDDRADAVRPSKRRKGLRLCDDRRPRALTGPGEQRASRLNLVAKPSKETSAMSVRRETLPAAKGSALLPPKGILSFRNP